jgi:hypothetical protein
VYEQKWHTCSHAMGITSAITSFEKFNSASRTAMVAAQVSQNWEPADGPDYPRIMTGYEYHEAKHVFGTIMPENGIVKGTVNKFTMGGSAKSSKTVLFVGEETGALDCVEIAQFDSPHDIAGWDYQEQPVVRQLRPGVPIAKGTRFNQPKSILPGGIYSRVLQANYCYMSHAPNIEDGMWVSDEFVKRAEPMAYNDVSFDWGSNYYPLGLYGTFPHFKPFPAPGEKVRPCGLVAAMRKKCPIFDMVGLLPTELSKPTQYDKKIYAPPESEDVVVADVDVLTTVNDNGRLPLTPIGMEEFPNIFARQKSAYYDKLLSIYDAFMRETNYKGRVSDKLANILTDAYADKPNDRRCRVKGAKKGSIQRTKRGSPIDEWVVSLKLKWRFKLVNGAKASNLHGSKGVFVRIVPKADMPTDEYGRSTDVVIYGGSTIARLNDGQLYEQYINASGDFVAMDAKYMLDQGDAKAAWEHVLNWYKIVAPTTTYLDVMNKGPQAQIDHINLIAEHGTHIEIHDDNEHVNINMARELKNSPYRPRKTKVTFRNLDGNMITTEKEVLIGSAAWIVLDKSSFKPMAVSVARKQGHGLPSTLNKATKVGSPTKRQASRGYAEAEIRGITAAVGAKATMDVVDLSVNPEATKTALQSMWNISSPQQWSKLIDREKIPYGSGRSVAMPRHTFECMGAFLKDPLTQE